MINTLSLRTKVTFICFFLLSSVAMADSVVVFNEIMYNTRTADEAEWVELYNQMGVDIDISNWSLQEGIEYVFPEGTIIKSDSYLVVTSDVNVMQDIVPNDIPLHGPFSGKLSNGGEELYLVNNSGRLLNELDYEDSDPWPIAPDGSGVSLAKLNQGKESDNPSNWAWSPQAGGTPGTENILSDQAITCPIRFSEMSSVTDDVFYLELINTSENAINYNGLYIEVQGSIDTSYNFPQLTLGGGEAFYISSTDLGFVPEEGDRVFLWSADGSLLDAVLADNTLRGRYPDGSGQWLYPSAATLGETNFFEICQDIVINEMMYHPIEKSATPDEIATETLLPEDSTCSVYVPNDDSLGNEWTGGNDLFSDIGWTDGTCGIGYEKDIGYESYIGTDVAEQMYLINPSIYIRIGFDVAEPNTIDNLLLSMRYDDGFIAYINGVEVAKANAPDNAAWNSEATASNLDSQATAFEVFDISGNLSALRQGSNILAIHGLNVTSSSSDFLIQPLLENTGIPSQEEGDEEWIELYNKGTDIVDLSGWSFTDGIDFTFPDGTLLDQGEYLVVAEKESWLSNLYPDAHIVGDFDGNLSNGGEIIVLSDQHGNPVDIVEYCDGGSWPMYADGGGCSLELTDPLANNNRAEAWAASNELLHSSWKEYAYQMTSTSSPVGNDSYYSEFIMGLLDEGEILIDDIEVVDFSRDRNYSVIKNMDFSSGTEKWRILGNHSTSVVVPDPDNSSNPVLKLIATGPTEHMSNHAETTLIDEVSNGHDYEVRFRARWLAGTPILNTRLFFNRVAYSTYLDVPEQNGTPGKINSQFKPNIGPTFSSLAHAPAVPLPDQPVTVTVKAEDPDGIRLLSLFYREDGENWSAIIMSEQGNSLYSAVIPGHAEETTIQFYVAAWDNSNPPASSYYPAAGPKSFAQYQVPGQMARATGVHNYRIVMRNEQKEGLYKLTDLMSNEYLGATLIVNEKDVYYNAGIRLKGSEHARPPNKQAGRIGFNLRLEKQNKLRGVHDSLGFDRSDFQYVGQEEMLLNTAMNHFGGPSKYHDLGYFMAPDSAHSSGVEVQMARYNKIFTEESYGDDGGSGTLYEYELVYPLTETIDGNPEGLKIPQEGGGYQGRSISSYLGTDKEKYRWHLLIKNNRDEDNYGPMMDMTWAFSQSGDAFEQAIEETLDVDEWIRTFAIGLTYAASDTWFTGTNNHNAMFYHRPSDDKILLFLHDQDGTQSSTRSITSNSYLTKITAANEKWNHLFYGYVYDFIQTSFNREYMTYWSNHYRTLLPEQSWSSWLSFIDNRNYYVQQQLDSTLPDEIPFEISTVSAEIDNDGMAYVEGQGWVNVNWILIVNTETILDVQWDSLTQWHGNIDTGLEPGTYTLEAYDSRNILLGSDTVELVSSH